MRSGTNLTAAVQALASFVHGTLADAHAKSTGGQPQTASTATTSTQQVLRQLMAMTAEVLGKDVSLDTPLMEVCCACGLLSHSLQICRLPTSGLTHEATPCRPAWTRLARWICAMLWQPSLAVSCQPQQYLIIPLWQTSLSTSWAAPATLYRSAAAGPAYLCRALLRSCKASCLASWALAAS